jgi:hypothetical protein
LFTKTFLSPLFSFFSFFCSLFHFFLVPEIISSKIRHDSDFFFCTVIKTSHRPKFYFIWPYWHLKFLLLIAPKRGWHLWGSIPADFLYKLWFSSLFQLYCREETLVDLLQLYRFTHSVWGQSVTKIWDVSKAK